MGPAFLNIHAAGHTNPDAAVVKCADIVHNLTDAPKPEGRARYLRALPRQAAAAETAWPGIRHEMGLEAMMCSGHDGPSGGVTRDP